MVISRKLKMWGKAQGYLLLYFLDTPNKNGYDQNFLLTTYTKKNSMKHFPDHT